MSSTQRWAAQESPPVRAANTAASWSAHPTKTHKLVQVRLSFLKRHAKQPAMACLRANVSPWTHTATHFSGLSKGWTRQSFSQQRLAVTLGVGLLRLQENRIVKAWTNVTQERSWCLPPLPPPPPSPPPRYHHKPHPPPSVAKFPHCAEWWVHIFTY